MSIEYETARCENGETVPKDDYSGYYGCGRRATHDCDGFNGGYICGLPLCENCRHKH